MEKGKAMSAAEREAEQAKQEFKQSVEEFGVLQIIKEYPLATVGISVLAGLATGFVPFSKLKTSLLSFPVLKIVSKRLKNSLAKQ